MQKQNIIKRLATRFLAQDEAGMFLFLALMCIGIGLANPTFWLATNIINLLRTSSLTVIAGVGVTFILITGNIDLSVGSTIGLGGMITGLLLVVAHAPIWLAIVFGTLVGAVVGLFNGTVITKFHIPAMIVTLGSMYIVRGIINVISEGRTVYPFPDEFKALGGLNGFLTIPHCVWITLAICIVAGIILRGSVFGRCLYAIGGNKETSRVSGLHVEGALCAFSGVIQAAKVNSSIANAGTGWELTVMAAVIIGGTSMFGGLGSILGTIIGALVLSVLTNGMVMLRINAFYQNIVLGIIIILAVGFDQYKRRNMERKGTSSKKENDRESQGGTMNETA